MNVFVLSCEFDNSRTIFGVYTTLISALETLSRQYLEEDEHIEDFATVDGQHSVVYTNMATYYIDEHILEGVNE